jgi:hypothetical protein
MEDGQFRFEHMEIWRRGADLSGRLFSLAEQLDDRNPSSGIGPLLNELAEESRMIHAFRRSLKS